MVKPTAYRDRDGVLHPATDEHREQCAPCRYREATGAPMVMTPEEFAGHNEEMRLLREQLSPTNPMTDELVASADPTDMPEGPERTKALRQMLIDTMSELEQTDDGERMAAALDAFDAKDAALKEPPAPPAPCEHVFSDADGRTRYTFCHRGCGARDPAEPTAIEAAEWDAAGAVVEAMLGIDSGPHATPEAEAIRLEAITAAGRTGR